MPAFHDHPLLQSLLGSLAEQGLTRPTDIQQQALPPLLDGRSFVGVAETGSGKTLAYVLPMLHQLKELDVPGAAVDVAGSPRGLVLVPGRELGEQVARVFKELTHATRLRVRTVLGGSKKQIARQNVSGKLEVLVATPGRLTQLMDSRQVRLDDVRMLVFDEADQMLDPGFLPVAKRIVGDCPKGVQLVMFSATMPGRLEAIIGEVFHRQPIRVRTKGSERVVPTLRTDNRTVVHGRRRHLLLDVIDEAPGQGTLLFANTREQCDKLGKWLHREDMPFARYMGQMDRNQRRENLARFRNGEVSLLIATDLGGRGLDIDRVERVINVHLPKDVDNYLHRVGRTARAGRKGLVVNFVTERDKPLMEALRALGAGG
ncbi:MAG: DEAD/DEAH box helicase [Proteobacteria bacterium]|nr:DEAD/DEAH box helicase [Pseudomonadota bacterium]